MEECVHLFHGEQTELGIVCECDDADCEARLVVSVSEYEHVRSDPRLFLVVAGHENPGIEQVMRARQHYLVVQKTGEAGEIAEQTSNR